MNMATVDVPGVIYHSQWCIMQVHGVLLGDYVIVLVLQVVEVYSYRRGL